jgi:hypothetical protein
MPYLGDQHEVDNWQVVVSGHTGSDNPFNEPVSCV